VSRRAPRIRAQLTVTVTTVMSGEMMVCRTRDVSDVGCFLDTDAYLDPGTRLALTIFDEARGGVIEVIGEVTRVLAGAARGIGVRLLEPPPDWFTLVAVARGQTIASTKKSHRLCVLVVGDDHRQRGALALYVTSGWDVRFASDLDGAAEALRAVGINAVIAEHDADDHRWHSILSEARRARPDARRIVRGAPGQGRRPDAIAGDLVHRFVERDAGLDALLDALTAEI